MNATRTYDVLIDSGDTVSGRFMTRTEAYKTVKQMKIDARECFPVTVVRYRSQRDQTIIESETIALADNSPEYQRFLTAMGRGPR